MQSRNKSGLGPVAIVGSIGILALMFGPAPPPGAAGSQTRGVSPADPVSGHVRLLALGDCNLGRRVGQEILSGDTLYPFARVADTLRSYDLVFANLESNISDQGGKTEDPRNNVIFTAPPAAARSLRAGGIACVSTANNHALDFGVSALGQTIRYLDNAGVAHCGTAVAKGRVYDPARVTINGIRLAFFAVTDVMNMTGVRWKRFVAAADTGALLPRVRAVRDSTDLVVVSFHGGNEYAATASARTKEFAGAVLRGGADLFLGHHPHVPYGIECVGRKCAVHSLGNFVFMQPDRYWTGYSYAVSFDIERDSAGTKITGMRVHPLRAGFQPVFLAAGRETNAIMERIRVLSSEDVVERITW